MLSHGLGQRFHAPTSRPVRGLLGHQLVQEQHIVVVIDDGAARTLLVFEPSQAEFLVAFPPNVHLVVVQIYELTNGSIRLALGHEQDHPSPLGGASLDGVGPHTRLEFGTVTSAEFEWRQSHPSVKSHQCYYREDALVPLGIANGRPLSVERRLS